jgi:cytochrome c-type protein NapC
MRGDLTWPLGIALGCAGMAAAILIWFLVRRPPLTRTVKGTLLLGFGVFPIVAAMIGNVRGYQRTTQRGFCGGCHTMKPWIDDSNDPTSKTLAAAHARNAEFGAENCYRCHEDYQPFGLLTTKLAGLRHVWLYYTEFKKMPDAEAMEKVVIKRPFPNANCMHCHSTETPLWNDVPEHISSAEQVKSGALSCASAGCHGPAHPFSRGGR